MKKLSLKDKVEIAERRERDAVRRVKDMDKRLRRANAVTDGAMIWVTVLASMMGPFVHIPKERLEEGKKKKYLARTNPDGSVDLAIEGYEGYKEEPDGEGA